MDLNIGQNKWEEIMSVKDTIEKNLSWNQAHLHSMIC